jgi:hypothetical protein
VKQHRLFGLLLAAVVLPFLVVGILGATKVAMWATGTSGDPQSHAFLIAALLLVPVGILLSGLLAYGTLVFFLKWFNPDHPLTAFADIESGMGRYLNPAFRAVHAFAVRLAPKRQ